MITKLDAVMVGQTSAELFRLRFPPTVKLFTPETDVRTPDPIKKSPTEEKETFPVVETVDPKIKWFWLVVIVLLVKEMDPPLKLTPPVPVVEKVRVVFGVVTLKVESAT